MNFPTIFDLLDRVAFLRGMPAVVILLLAGYVAIVAWDFRLSLVALLVLYLSAGLLLVDVLDPRLAVVYALGGIFVTAILGVTGWQVNWGRPPAGLTADEIALLGLDRRRVVGRFSVPVRFALRAVLGLGVLVGAAWMAQSQTSVLALVPVEQSYLRPAILGLAGLGLTGAATSAEPLPSGTGLLVFLVGFALYYAFLDQSIAMTVALVAAYLVASLAVSYLAQARYLPADILD